MSQEHKEGYAKKHGEKYDKKSGSLQALNEMSITSRAIVITVAYTQREQVLSFQMGSPYAPMILGVTQSTSKGFPFLC